MENKIILVTGASRGIGRDIAYTLAKEGYTIIANYKQNDLMANSLKELADKEKINIEIYKADVSKRTEVKEMIKHIINKYKRIDVLINNAGIDLEKLFQDVTDEEWNNIMNVNLYSVFCTTQEVIRNMINNKNGLIINISSISGVKGASYSAVYAASKAGIDGITKSLAKELGLSNIRVNSIAPGAIDTDMNKYLTQEEMENLVKETPLGRMGNPRDISRCVKWLIEDEFTTGQIISIDGGWNS